MGSMPKQQSNRLAESTESQSQLEAVNAQAEFRPDDPEGNIAELAEKAFPGNIEEQERYKAKIIASLEKHVNGSKEELWAYLKSKYTKVTAIIEGILRFFAGEVGEDEVGLEKFLKPMHLPAESNLDKAYMAQRTEAIENTKTQLTALLDEIRAQNPNV